MTTKKELFNLDTSITSEGISRKCIDCDGMTYCINPEDDGEQKWICGGCGALYEWRNRAPRGSKVPKWDNVAYTPGSSSYSEDDLNEEELEI